MAQQIILIHGGETFRSYDEYLENLKHKDFSVEKLQRTDWKSNLPDLLWPSFEVIQPKMPNKQNAKYLEWMIWFEKVIPFMAEEVILIGHSLGGLFLAKYLSENQLPRRIRATMLVAAPMSAVFPQPLADFVLPESLDLFAKQAGEIVIYHSEDDQVAPYASALAFHKALPHSELVTLQNQGHVNDKLFPELEKKLWSLT